MNVKIRNKFIDIKYSICVSYRYISRLSIVHAKFVFLYLHVAFVGSDFNAISMQRVCSTSESAYGACVLCLSLVDLCVKCEE